VAFEHELSKVKLSARGECKTGQDHSIRQKNRTGGDDVRQQAK